MKNNPIAALNGVFKYQPKAWIRVSGEDSYEFLQSQFSNDLANQAIGDAVYGLWLDHKGRVHGDSFVYRAGEEEFYLFSYSTEEAVILKKLGAFIVADDVDLEGEGETVVGMSFLGSDLEVFRKFLDDSGRGFLKSRKLIFFKGRRSADASYELVGSLNAVAEVLELFQAAENNFVELENQVIELSRIQSRIPLVPQDIGVDNFPQEGGLFDCGVSLNKGCYLGQEVMGRIESRGKVRKRLELLELCGEYACGETIYCEGKKVGLLKTNVVDGERVLALGILNIDSLEGRLCCEDDEKRISVLKHSIHG